VTPWIARIGLALGAVAGALVAHPSWAEPRLPVNDSEVLERLPTRPTDPTGRELATLRTAVQHAAKYDPSGSAPATQLGQRYFDLAMARGDPRYVGYAEAVIRPFDQAPTATLWVLRGQLFQYRHHFDEALQAFGAALTLDPQLAAARAWRGAIYLVQADYPLAQTECKALHDLQRTSLYGACIGLTHAYSGQLAQAQVELHKALAATQDSGNRLWLLTRLGEVAAWRGQTAQAEAAYRAALALGLDDGYLLAAWADFLLDQGRPAEVLQWLGKWESSDTLLLRLALAEVRLNNPTAAAHIQALNDRFAAAKLRGDTTHRAEEARFELQLRGNPQRAVELAAANYQVQREPRDARVLLEASIAARNAEAGHPARDWLARSGFEDRRLRQLGVASATVAPAGNSNKAGAP
jgi:tetratricopeptide (TPR) repeat protein